MCRAIVLFNLIPLDFKFIADQNRSRLGYAETRSTRLPTLIDHLAVDYDHIVGRTAVDNHRRGRILLVKFGKGRQEFVTVTQHGEFGPLIRNKHISFVFIQHIGFVQRHMRRHGIARHFFPTVGNDRNVRTLHRFQFISNFTAAFIRFCFDRLIFRHIQNARIRQADQLSAFRTQRERTVDLRRIDHIVEFDRNFTRTLVEYDTSFDRSVIGGSDHPHDRVIDCAVYVVIHQIVARLYDDRRTVLRIRQIQRSRILHQRRIQISSIDELKCDLDGRERIVFVEQNINPFVCLIDCHFCILHGSVDDRVGIPRIVVLTRAKKHCRQ